MNDIRQSMISEEIELMESDYQTRRDYAEDYISKMTAEQVNQYYINVYFETEDYDYETINM